MPEGQEKATGAPNRKGDALAAELRRSSSVSPQTAARAQPAAYLDPFQPIDERINGLDERAGLHHRRTCWPPGSTRSTLGAALG